MNIKSGILCGKGWEKIYSQVLEAIWTYDDQQTNPLDKVGVKVVTSQDGKLSVQVENDYNLPKDIENIIQYAETESLKYCEFCGTKENLGTTLNNDYITCCQSCWEENILPKYENSLWKNYQTNKYLRKTNYTV